MYLSQISLQNFRNYSKKEFKFSPNITLVAGPNTSGKSNLIEALYFLASGRSFRIERDEHLVKFGKDVARIKGKAEDSPSTFLPKDKTIANEISEKVQGKDLEVVIAQAGVGGHLRPFKKYLVNGVSKRKVDFVGNFFAVLFAPGDLEIIIAGPSKRRDFINNILIQTDRDYRLAETIYEKGLRARNALLHKAKENGIRSEKEFAYWDNLLIVQGQKITKKREEFIDYLRNAKKDILKFEIFYDKSIISKVRLLQYKDAEIGAGVTLVGPHRDDFIINLINNKEEHDIRFFGSRGQQRLTVLQLKLLELIFIEQKTGEKPVLLLDDIFSELDEGHINLVLENTLLRASFAEVATKAERGFGGQRQTIITTTHEEFIPKRLLKEIEIISLGKKNKPL